jgi:hypothetical protein
MGALYCMKIAFCGHSDYVPCANDECLAMEFLFQNIPCITLLLCCGEIPLPYWPFFSIQHGIDPSQVKLAQLIENKRNI